MKSTFLHSECKIKHQSYRIKPRANYHTEVYIYLISRVQFKSKSLIKDRDNTLVFIVHSSLTSCIAIWSFDNLMKNEN